MSNPENRYADIIGLPHHVSPTRSPMPMSDRAAQFSPFAALVGFDAAIQETGRLTEARISPEEEMLTQLDRKFQVLMDRRKDRPQISITYFQADARKAGGAYREISGIVKKLDPFARLLTLEDGQVIPMDDIFSLEGDIFAGLD